MDRRRFLKVASGGGPAKTPGAKSDRELNAPTTSRKWCPSPKPGASAPVSVIDCIYRFDGTGIFTGTGGTWGTAKYIELYMLADDDEYSKAKTGICFVDLVQYDFVVTTRAELKTYWQRVDNSNILRTDGSPIEVHR
jgi:hypothetical protein